MSVLIVILRILRYSRRPSLQLVFLLWYRLQEISPKQISLAKADLVSSTRC
uniref:Uncharacterized protein n=1 Tax=Triticum urartu TaxID=4572 RepID=A0A8R7TMU5_TRIUA